MPESTALVTVVSGDAYHDFSDAMLESAREHFHPTEEIIFRRFNGPEGWPAATLMRYHVLLRWLPRAHYVFMIDADAVFEQEVGPEILPPHRLGITATLHPGYVGKPRGELPYERRPESAAYIGPYEGHSAYYAGGFVGGERLAVRILAAQIANIIDADEANGIIPTWHDESCLNRVLATAPPAVSLSPAYCHPDRDDYYREHVWTEPYERRIVMLDKSGDERGER